MNYASCNIDFDILKKVPSESLVTGQKNTGDLGTWLEFAVT